MNYKKTLAPSKGTKKKRPLVSLKTLNFMNKSSLNYFQQSTLWGGGGGAGVKEVM